MYTSKIKFSALQDIGKYAGLIPSPNNGNPRLYLKPDNPVVVAIREYEKKLTAGQSVL